MNVLVAGGSGFVGRHVVSALSTAGHAVRVMTRSPSDGRDDGAEDVFGDVDDESTLVRALDGVDVAYYLVHSLERADFVERDAKGAEAFARQAAASGVGRVVYLGGLGDDDDELSAHL
ncbi:MAG: NAD(P)H-binding protein, partial [Actinomycetota bacterium]|nr:NAD(P)H-binding protein [Actinomycetota bacterium]